MEPRKIDAAFARASIRRQVTRGSIAHTDGFKTYRGIWAGGYIRRFVDHAGGEYARSGAHANNIEGFWGIMKRKMAASAACAGTGSISSSAGSLGGSITG